MPDKNKKELIIIGAGPGGYAAAFKAADLGMKVCLIDPEENPGGVCLYRGCIPSKALLNIAKIKQEAQEASEWGIEFGDPKIDIDKIRKWKDKVVKKLTDGLGQLAENRNIEYIRDKAGFVSNEKIRLKDSGKELGFKHLILATGSSNLELPGIEIDHKKVIDSADALELQEIPKSMLVIGGGYIGLEMGSVYAALDSDVSVAEMTEDFLPGTDRDLVKVFQDKHPFKDLYFNTKIEKLSVEDKKVSVELKMEDGTKEKQFDKVLVAAGRKPSTASLDLENTEIKVDENGFIEVDEKRRTAVENIYAIGDLTGEPMLAHKANYEARIAAEVISDDKASAYDPRSIPGIVFTNPEIAWSGLTETEASEKDMEVKILKFPWSASGRALSMGTSTGLTKLLVDPETGRILGGGVAGKDAGSLISEISLAIEMAATAEDLSLSIHPHPTLSETIMEAAESFMGVPTHLAK
ncbi:dihydrolipoyl dehydrogenase [Gramella sp. GC03-9]|uniref:Dihydrolipoyl dehydrogenase n=1 Tax=Christiangramia oceanisediminis TaxID=2920386 RepID=A0A9X2R9C5_9FLAO|nr:dihydrolipoyl dehydrogenase [Gramella oceanisediminis]MCP9200827.1 dihydrolipoyl dehydrogenase [Gramella oceanisediminis]